MSTAPPPTPARRPRRWLLLAGLAALVAALAGGGWWLLRQRAADRLVEASHANARGIGWMEQFKYAEAAAEFDRARDLAPGWVPARVNYGIALYNSATKPEDPVLDRAVEVFRDVLRDDPANLHAHFNIGVITRYRGQYEEAAVHFAKVTEADPTDDRAWLYLAQSDPRSGETPDALRHFEKALALNPYLNAARYGVMSHVDTEPARREALMAEFGRLERADVWDEARPDRYSEQGRYAAAIGPGPAAPPAVGPLPLFAQESPWAVDFRRPGPVAWAAPAAADGPDGAVRAAARDRFGGVLVRLDYNKDGRPDLLLLSAVTRDGGPRDVLLRNDGGGRFADVSDEAGLSAGPGSLGAAAGDFDNDGFPDLALTGTAGVRLLRNAGGARFEDNTKAAGFDALGGVCLAVLWVDLDQDGDLDLVVGRYADDPAGAARLLRGEAADAPGGRLAVFVNVGEAPPGPPGVKVGALTCAFRPATEPLPLLVPGPVAGVVAADLDGDKDVDLAVLVDGRPPAAVLNDRLMRFRAGLQLPAPAGRWAGGLVVDANGDDQSDVVLVGAERPAVLASTKDAPDEALGNRFAPGATDAPALLQAHRCDLDLDGRADMVGLSRDRKPVLLQGDGAGKLMTRPDPFGPAPAGLAGLLAVAAGDLDGDCNPDLVAWAADGLRFFPGKGNGNRGLKVALTGVRQASDHLRTNASGIGAKVAAQTGSLVARVELTTLSAGPGQSLLPADLGVGRAARADAVRLRWPDAVVQAELNTPACEPVTVEEINRKSTSCPVLMTWDGAKWVCVTDFLGGGALGELGPDGSVRPPRPEESVRIEPHQLGLKDGAYVLRIAEPMDEVLYLDHARLDVVDHPADLHVHPDERFATAAPLPTQQLLGFRDRVFPAAAADHRGRDVAATLRERDGKTADGFAHRSWLGFAEDQWVELDFADRLKGLPAGRPVYLVLAGWTDYPYPESIYAATQAGVKMVPPVLERKVADGRWERVGDVGFPAGLPKVMTVPATDWVAAGGTKFRIRTNLRIYWDQVYVAPLAETPGEGTAAAKVYRLPPARADLSRPGFVREISPGPRRPVAYDPDRFEPVAVTRWQGDLTRLGDVTELAGSVDDRFVLCGPGDEVTVRFDAAGLPPVPAGWVRSFVLRTHGYCKDTAPTTLSGGRVGPLPVRGMGHYPAQVPADPGRDADRKAWHTRPAAGGD